METVLKLMKGHERQVPPYMTENSYYEQISQMYLAYSRGKSQEITHDSEINSLYLLDIKREI